MTEQEWQASDDPSEMLELITPGRSQGVGKLKAWMANDRKLRLWCCALCRLNGTEAVVVDGYERDGFVDAYGKRYSDSTWAYLWSSRSKGVAQATKATLLREIIGNPFHPENLHPDWLAWDNGVVGRLAEAIYAEQYWQDLPVLADALEEAGCDNAEILAHCRGPGPHVRGCWVVDLLLGMG